VQITPSRDVRATSTSSTSGRATPSPTRLVDASPHDAWRDARKASRSCAMFWACSRTHFRLWWWPCCQGLSACA